MAQHIGIVACSAEGAALCYRTICLEGQDQMGKYAHPEITMHTHPLNEYMRHIETNDWPSVAKLMLSSAEKLAKAGADFLICPDNTIHQAFDLVVEKTPLPWLHIAREVAFEAKRRNFHHLGILGTRFLMDGPVYPNKLSPLDIAHSIPQAQDRMRINEIIFDQLVSGRIADASKAYFAQVIEGLKTKGCDAVVLGCTEIPLLVTPESSPLPTLDSTRLLARAALRRAISTITS